MNYNTSNNQCDICAGSGKCHYCGGKNYDEMITKDRMRNAFYDTVKKGKLYKIIFRKGSKELTIEEGWLAFGESMDYANQFKIEKATSNPFHFYEKTYTEIIGNVGFLMATHVMISGDSYYRLVTCRMNDE